LLAQVSLLFAVTYGAARLSWGLIEQPALALKDRLIAPRQDAGGRRVAPPVTGA
jgi:peptidoglycan/LPS O-acetylase OafA/YrhL